MTFKNKNQDRDNWRRYANKHSYLDRRALRSALSQEEKEEEEEEEEEEKEEDPATLMFL